MLNEIKASNSSEHLDFTGVSNPCRECHSRPLSVCSALSPDQLEELAVTADRIRLSAHGSLFDSGDASEYVFTVNSGALKLFQVMMDGRRQVLGFPYPGDFFGFDSVDRRSYSAEALTETVLCRFSRRAFENHLRRQPLLNHQFLCRSSETLSGAHAQMTLLGRKNAAERLATFLMRLLNHPSQHSPTLIALPMTRADIADYLGLTTETVSRTLTQLRNRGLITLRNSEMIDVVDRETLHRLAEGVHSSVTMLHKASLVS